MITADGLDPKLRYRLAASASLVFVLLAGVIGFAPSAFPSQVSSLALGTVAAGADLAGSATLGAAVVVGDQFTPMAPVRILDSRPDGGSPVGPYSTPWTTGTTRDVAVGGVSGVPASADAVVLNVTVTETTASSFLTIWPAGQTRPTVSSLNWTQGRTIPNAVTVKLGAGGKISIFNLFGKVDVIADVAGYYDAISVDGFTSLPPTRVLDSRVATNVGDYASPWMTGTTRDVAVGGRGGVPEGADAVVLNVTATDTTGSSFLTVWPAGEPTRPTASSLNWRPGRTIPNAVTVKLGAGGKISIFNLSGKVDVVIDVAGYYQAGTGNGFHPVDPVRVLDSRPDTQVGPYSSPWAFGTTRDVTVGGLLTVPIGADAAVLNVTATDTTGSSFLTVWPAGQTRPTASSLNWTPGVTIPNAVTGKLGTAGKISVYNLSGTVDVVVDVSGWFG